MLRLPRVACCASVSAADPGPQPRLPAVPTPRDLPPRYGESGTGLQIGHGMAMEGHDRCQEALEITTIA